MMGSQCSTIDGLVGQAASLCSVAEVLPAEEELPMLEGLHAPLFRCTSHCNVTKTIDQQHTLCPSQSRCQWCSYKRHVSL